MRGEESAILPGRRTLPCGKNAEDGLRRAAGAVGRRDI